jgi:hypothetical protein
MPIYLNQVQRHLIQLQHMAANSARLGHQGHHAETALEDAAGTEAADSLSHSAAAQAATATQATTVSPKSAALVLATRSLAKQGTPSGIARYLSEVLNMLGVSVQVNVHALPVQQGEGGLPWKRLWIICEAPYSPDPVVLAEPTAQRLRDLELEGFRDAVILIQVQGEPQPEWFLRVDLTPPTEMLREWSRWGDVPAIARLANRELKRHHIRVTAELKRPTLYLFCRFQFPTADVPSQEVVQPVLVPLLESLAPQGIRAVVLYGQGTDQAEPSWMHWLNLPANEHEALAPTVRDLARQGDIPALRYLLMRSLNPDLEQQLKTGGIRIQVRQKEDLLHIVADAPVCPKQRQVGVKVAKIVRSLRIPQIEGVRVYGRRAGQKRPLWCYGSDFQSRQRRVVPEAAPEFAASDAYVGDLITQSEEAVAMRPEVTSESFQAAVSSWYEQRLEQVRMLLLRSQLVVPQADAQDLSLEPEPTPSRAKLAKLSPIAVVWGTVGLLLVAQTDWILGQILNTAQSAPDPAAPTAVSPAPVPSPEAEEELAFWQQADLSLNASTTEDDAFDRTDFTEDEPSVPLSPDVADDSELEASALQPIVPPENLDLAYSTFNSRQLDIKLALYQQQVDQAGPPDVLVLGSSRALRGVDPVALQSALAEQGYEDLRIFNFGLNGATAQVADLVIRRMLTPDQLPQMIIWADGARAFNSGRLDVTYNGVVASQGYEEFMAARAERVPEEEAAAEVEEDINSSSLFDSYQAVDQRLESLLAKVSATYSDRDRLKSALHQQVVDWMPAATKAPTAEMAALTAETAMDPDALLTDEGESMIDANGFLPVSTQFNPATYYQQYARVSGRYDGDYENFNLQGKQAEALTALLDFTEAEGIPLVFVNTPLTDEYLDAVRQEHEQEFLRWMLQLSATRDGLLFRDAAELWPQQYRYFSDPSHLNRYGAYQVSERLAQDPMIAWPQPE